METEHGGESVRRDNGHSDDPYKNGKEYPATVRGSRSVAASDGSVVLEHMFEGHRVRTITKDGETWFVAADVCAILEHSDPSKAVSRLDDDERGSQSIVWTPGGDQTLNVVNLRAGLCALVFTSRKPHARAFRRWVTGVVLPAIRHTGSFILKSGSWLQLPDLGSSQPHRPGQLLAAHVRRPDPPLHRDGRSRSVR